MPKMTFFSNPKLMAVAVGTASMFSLLIPTCLELVPLGNKKNSGQDDLDKAQGEYDAVLNQFNVINGQIRENEQRILDSDCARTKSSIYNDRISTFQQNIKASNASPSNRLDLFWQLEFANDQTKVDQSSQTQSFTEYQWRYAYAYSCSSTCGENVNCCYNYGYHYVPETSHYSIITTIKNEYKNIITGVGMNTMSLNCGYYSHDLQALPQTYLIHESGKTTTGNRENGAVRVNFKREWGSRVLAKYTLDEHVVSNEIMIPRGIPQTDAVVELENKLYQFLIMAIAAFNTTSNYSLIQEEVKQRIPGLQAQATEVHAVLDKKASILANKRDLFYSSENQYKNGLSIWLPLFFLVPPVLSVITYCLVNHYNKKNDAKNVNHDIKEEKPISVVTLP